MFSAFFSIRTPLSCWINGSLVFGQTMQDTLFLLVLCHFFRRRGLFRPDFRKTTALDVAGQGHLFPPSLPTPAGAVTPSFLLRGFVDFFLFTFHQLHILRQLLEIMINFSFCFFSLLLYGHCFASPPDSVRFVVIPVLAVPSSHSLVPVSGTA